MSSGFVLGGTTDNPNERDEQWIKAQQELEATRRRKEEEGRQENGKTLYDILQANKAAKQDAFEESIRLKNQFRNLDEDEIEFLDSVLESTREKEQAVKKETSEQLEEFRRLQEEADKASLESTRGALAEGQVAAHSRSEESQWAVNSRKRKRVKDKDGPKVVKLRKSSTSNTPARETSSDSYTCVTYGSPGLDKVEVQSSSFVKPAIFPHHNHIESTPNHSAVEVVNTPVTKTAVPSLGLAAYSSDED